MTNNLNNCLDNQFWFRQEWSGQIKNDEKSAFQRFFNKGVTLITCSFSPATILHPILSGLFLHSES